MSLLPFVDIFSKVLDIVFPDKTAIAKADLELKKDLLNSELQKAMAAVGLLKGQLDVNQAEAANPNRKWMTWREILGYFLAFAVGYEWLIKPALLFIFLASGHPLAKDLLPTLDMTNILGLLGAMLGIQIAPAAWESTKNVVNKMKSS